MALSGFDGKARLFRRNGLHVYGSLQSSLNIALLSPSQPVGHPYFTMNDFEL
jgi:hypothetical protein